MGPGVRGGRLVEINASKQKWPGSLPAIFFFDLALASPRHGARGRRRQRGHAAVEQWRDAADSDAPVDAAWAVGLFFQILRAVALRGQVFRGHPELLCEQLG